MISMSVLSLIVLVLISLLIEEELAVGRVTV